MKEKKRWNRFFLCLFFLLLFSHASLAASIDTALFTGKKSELINRYEQLLKKLNTPQNENYATQKTIISTLINILNTPTKSEPKLGRIKDQRSFLTALRRLAHIIREERLIIDKIDDINKKLKTLKKAIYALDNTSSILTTYQLQYALYKISLNKLKEKQKILDKVIPILKNTLYKSMLIVKFDKDLSLKNINRDIDDYKRLNDSIERLNIEKDRLSLVGSIKQLEIVKNQLSNFIDLRDQDILDIIENYIAIELYQLKNSMDMSETQNSISKWVEKLSEEKNVELANRENDIAFFMIKKKLGVLKTFLEQTGRSLANILTKIWNFINKPIIIIGQSKISIISIAGSLMIFVLGIYSGRVFRSRIKQSKLSSSIPVSARAIISNIGYYTIITITFFIGLKVIGVDLSSLTVILGALSVGVGFGLQNMVANFISGIILMLENTIRIGDYIELSEDLKGVVKDIQMRSTTILTNDNIEVIVPNQTLFQNNVINWTLEEKIRRFRIPFGVAYGTDVKLVEKVILDALKNSGLNYIKNNPEKRPEIKMIAMNSSSVDFELDVWVEGDDVLYPRRTQSKFLIMIYNALNENNITIPFPQLDLHVKEPVRIVKDNADLS